MLLIPGGLMVVSYSQVATLRLKTHEQRHPIPAVVENGVQGKDPRRLYLALQPALPFLPAMSLVTSLGLLLVAFSYLVENLGDERRVKPNAITFVAILLRQLSLLIAT